MSVPAFYLFETKSLCSLPRPLLFMPGLRTQELWGNSLVPTSHLPVEMLGLQLGTVHLPCTRFLGLQTGVLTAL